MLMVLGSMMVSHVWVMHLQYHCPRGVLSFNDDPPQYHRHSSWVQVFQMGFEGWDCWGKWKLDDQDQAWPVRAHAQIDSPLVVVQMSAIVVAPRYKEWHHCAWYSSFVVMLGRKDNSSMMNVLAWHWGLSHGSGSKCKWKSISSRKFHKWER